MHEACAPVPPLLEWRHVVSSAPPPSVTCLGPLVHVCVCACACVCFAWRRVVFLQVKKWFALDAALKAFADDLEPRHVAELTARFAAASQNFGKRGEKYVAGQCPRTRLTLSVVST